ncbi:tyrosine-type recombinase/integrase [Sphingobacterium sp. 1.A.4]|nr:tyrosine-type recombinase/integrase [Sphingobacterium sp. 1.A.4]
MLTQLIQSGINIRIVQELLGHENIKTTMIYTYITELIRRRF